MQRPFYQRSISVKKCYGQDTSFMGNGDKMEQNNDVTLISPPATIPFRFAKRLEDLQRDYAMNYLSKAVVFSLFL